ncbi:MAG: hypothetical protein HC815_29465 [Richelia sp. RM1_1_1]|nr:hypothetical protein [Richelia sp. RM1_1_1]
MIKKPKGWYKQIVLRPVVHVDGYASYEKICSYVADNYFSVDEKRLETGIRNNPRESMFVTLYTLLKVGQAKCPTYWVARDLLEALLQSSLTVEAENLNWAMKTGILMLPKDTILSPENKSIDAIYWHYDTEENILFWACNDNDSAFCRRLPLNTNKIFITDSGDIDASALKQFNEYLQSIFLRLILIMQCRPELIDATDRQQKITVNKGFGKAQAQEFYQPSWIGQGYRLKREGTVSSDDDANKQGGSKRPHWRKGFIRNQPYGEGRQKTKLVWIEPVLVMGGE